jgi:DNA-binding response OmpR family regulator
MFLFHMKAKQNKKIKGLGKIVLVEDDEFVSKAYLFFLRKAGFTVVHVDNGMDVYKTVKKEKPNIVLLDLIIPGKNGFEVLAELKSSPLKHIPIIIVSNLGQETDEITCRSLGASDYIIKSNLRSDDVIDRVKRYIHM